MGYAYTDKYGFSHVTDSKDIAERNAATGSGVYEYSGKNEGGYAVSSDGSRVAVNTPGARDYGNANREPAKEVTLSQSGAYSKLLGPVVGIGYGGSTQYTTGVNWGESMSGLVKYATGSNWGKTMGGIIQTTEKRADSAVFSPISIEQYVQNYKKQYGYYPWEGVQTKDGSIPSNTPVYNSAMLPGDSAQNLASLFSLPTSPGDLKVNANLSNYLVFGGLVLLVIKLFKRG